MQSSSVDVADLFAAEARVLCDRLRRLPASAWPSSDDAVHALAQRLADAAASLEGEPARSLPRLDSSPALPDQLAVVADDLARAAAGAGASGRVAVESALRDLGGVARL